MTAKENLEKLKSFVISLFSEQEVVDTTVETVETVEAPVVDVVIDTIVDTEVKVEDVVIDEVKVDDVDTKVEVETKVETVEEPVEETVAISVEKFKSFEEIEKLYNDLKVENDNKDLKIKELQDVNEKLSKSPAAEPTNLEGQTQTLTFSERMIMQTKLMREQKGLSY